ncbi:MULTISPECIES: DUF4474 domain-containing protein [Dehalobacter]|jgi:hypothetical protein|uniref:DUF4474 domain-containing protein n=2 Tax=Dehalobacter restrictus TaxID=55583 RepID=A0A857DKH0_9FIRM|nr:MULTISPECIES: DUF4474 domain-containing protein [Dehalobacter]MCG1025118.1 DUF4474 domain-containing protein [Dehalobacter sp.]QHA00636.1 DUF4474 domain-containing protein [Dehalobacter restrictus]
MLFHKSNAFIRYPIQTGISNPEIMERLAVPAQGTGDPDLDQVIENAGYRYDPGQDIFYATLNPWQRNAGYCRIYDEVSAPTGMIIDCEPVYFEYDGKKWMIGFWKGQYDLVTGGEIGIYTGAFHFTLPGIFSGMFYKSADNDELLPMSFVLRKNGSVLFTRSEKHWWLTGFKLGEFSDPSELTMDIDLAFPNTAMRDAFLNGLRDAGYNDQEFYFSGNNVSFTFAKPHTVQPRTRKPSTDRLIQAKNKLLCDKYQEITGPYRTMQDKMKAIESLAPQLYQTVLRLGKSKEFYELWMKVLILGLVGLFGYRRSRELFEHQRISE